MSGEEQVFVAEAAMTPEELAAYARRYDARTRAAVPVRGAWRGTAIGVLLAVGGAVAVRALGIVRGDGAAFLLGLLLMAAYGLGIVVMRESIGRYYADVRDFVYASSDMQRQHRRFVMDADGIRTAAEAGTGHWSWGAVTEVEEAEGLLIFYVGHVHGFAIPLRAFADAGEARAAVAFARDRVAAAHPP